MTWQELLGLGTMHGGMEAPWSLRKRKGAARSQKRRPSGAKEKDSRESGSEAGEKIETDFLAGVEIKRRTNDPTVWLLGGGEVGGGSKSWLKSE